MSSSDKTLDSNMNTTKEHNELDIPTEVLCPHIESPDIIEKFLQEKYGLKALQLKPLNGYDDRNYHVLADPSHASPSIDAVSPNGYLLKISNLQVSQRPELLYAQRAIMDYLTEKGITVQSVIKTVDGTIFSECTAANKKGVPVTYMVSLRSYLPGQILARATLTPQLLYDIGVYVAKLTEALKDFHHPFYDTFDCLWSFNNVPKVAKITYAVKDEKMRQISEEVLQAFNNEIIPNKPGFRTGQTHGDINEQNILVTEESNPNSSPQICGLLDFQDSVKSYPIYDLFMCIAYMSTCTHVDVPLLDIPGHILAGYLSVMSLTCAERKVLKVGIASRLVQSLVNGAYTFSLDPSNVYVLETARTGWKALETLWEADKETLDKRWDEIISSHKKA